MFLGKNPEADMPTGQEHAHWSRWKYQQEIKTKCRAEGTYTVSVPYSSWNIPAEIPTITKGRPTTVEWLFLNCILNKLISTNNVITSIAKTSTLYS